MKIKKWLRSLSLWLFDKTKRKYKRKSKTDIPKSEKSEEEVMAHPSEVNC
jgi:hypothetical protein